MLTIRPLLNVFGLKSNLQFASLIPCLSAIKEEGSIDFPQDELRKALEIFGQECPGVDRPIVPGDFLSVSDAKETLYFKIMPAGFQEWVRQGSLLVRSLPKPCIVKTFDYIPSQHLILKTQLLDRAIGFYIACSVNGEDIDHTHLGELEIATDPACLSVWNDDRSLQAIMGILLNAAGLPDAIWL